MVELAFFPKNVCHFQEDMSLVLNYTVRPAKNPRQIPKISSYNSGEY